MQRFAPASSNVAPRFPYRLYGCAPRATAEQVSRLVAAKVAGLEIASLETAPPAAGLRQHQEHSYLLDALVSRALSEGCSAVATFDMDSWPVMRGWDRYYCRLLNPHTPIATIVRTELGDNFPFAAFTLIDGSFWRSGDSSFRADPASSLGSRPQHTGCGILDQLAREGKRFYRLERSNAWSVHPVMAGLYDDAIFHLGAGSRSPRFSSDDNQYDIQGKPLRREFANYMNQTTREGIVLMLKEKHDAFVNELAGSGIERFDPILSDPRTLPRRLGHTAREQRDKDKTAGL